MAECVRRRSRRTCGYNAVDLVTLQPGDHVVHSQHRIGKFVEMRERTVGGATREYLVLEYASSKRGQPADRLFGSRYHGVSLANACPSEDWRAA